MIQRLSNGIVNWQIKKNILTSEQRALYQYAYMVFLNQFVNILIAFLIAVIMRRPLTVFLFLASYIPLRSYCGGFHAKTNGGCTLVSALLTLAVCFAEKVITGTLSGIMSPVSIIISGVLIWRFAPVSDKNKPLDEKETIRYRKKSRQIWLIEVVLGMFFLFFSTSISTVIALSHIILSIMLVYGIINNHRN